MRKDALTYVLGALKSSYLRECLESVSQCLESSDELIIANLLRDLSAAGRVHNGHHIPPPCPAAPPTGHTFTDNLGNHLKKSVGKIL